MAGVGRPKKPEEDKAKYQLVAVNKKDYVIFKKKLGSNIDSDATMINIIGRFMRLYEPGMSIVTKFDNGKLEIRN